MELARIVVGRVLRLLGSRDDEEEEEAEFVTKCGHLWRVDSNGKWVRRWFELREDVLASYKSEDRTKLKNAIKVSKISKIELTPGSKFDDEPLDFVMRCGTSTYPFRAESPEDAASWVRNIEKRMRRLPQ